VALADGLGVGDKFKFVGNVGYTSLGRYVNVADVCVAPYTREIPNCPIKIYEYLACGKPVVCSDIPGVDNLKRTDALVFVEPENPQALALALLRVLANMNLRTAQRELGPKAVSGYSWVDTATKVAAICKEAAHKENK
jgi:glycosyltransferase involved in cell wall biosynthesis